MGLDDPLSVVLCVRHRDRGHLVRNRLKDRFRLESLATIVLLVVITALFASQWYERRHRLADDRRAICAIRDYIEGQFAVTAAVPGTPEQVIIARRKVVQRFEDRMDGNCGGPSMATGLVGPTGP